jgi:hypothetical protein
VSLPAGLVVPALEELVRRTAATEVRAPDGGPFLTLRTVDDGSPAGRVRVFTSEAVPRIVYSNLDVPSRGMDTHMFYAFTAPGSAVPHFTLDAVATRGILAFHVDLVPRVDLATHVDYMDAVYGPLDALHKDVAANEELTAASIPSRGRALMSPWMLANRTSEQAWPAVAEPCIAYLEHWLGLVANGVGDDVLASLADTDLVARDALLRRSLFGLDIDPAWDHVASVVGAEPVAALRNALLGGRLD